MAAFVPGLDEAISREQRERHEAYLDLPYSVCGVLLRQMTPLDYCALQYARSPFLVGGEITHPKAAHFTFWLRKNPLETIDDHLNSVAKLETEECREEIEEYLTVTFRDETSSVSKSVPIAPSIAWYEYRMSGEPFRWSSEKTINTPIRRLNMLVRCWQKEHGETVINPHSHGVISRYRDDLQAKLKSGEMTPEQIVALSNPD